MSSLQMEYIMAESKPKDGKLLAIGHSMGGILLYAMLSRCGENPFFPHAFLFLYLYLPFGWNSLLYVLLLILDWLHTGLRAVFLPLMQCFNVLFSFPNTIESG